MPKIGLGNKSGRSLQLILMLIAMRKLCLTLTLALATGLRSPAGVACGRRSAIFGAAACSTLAWPSMAHAEEVDVVSDTKAILERARQQKLTAERVVQRARSGKLLKTGEGIMCTDYYAIRAIDDTALSNLNKEIKAYKKVEKDLIKEGESDVAVFFSDKAKETQRLILSIQEAQAAIRAVEAGMCQ